MEFETAYKTIVKASKERNTKEIPAILSCLDFEDKKCLEICPGPLARLSVKLSGFVKHIYLLEKNKSALEKIKKVVKRKRLKRKLKPTFWKNSGKNKFPFLTNSFDVVYAAWIPHPTLTNEKFLKEVVKVTKRHILFVIPGIEGDEPKLVSIVRKNERQRREKMKKEISSFLKKKGFKINFKQGILNLDFKDKKEIRETFYCLAFKNDEKTLSRYRNKINKFLDDKVHNFKDGFYILHAEKQS